MTQHSAIHLSHIDEAMAVVRSHADLEIKKITEQQTQIGRMSYTAQQTILADVQTMKERIVPEDQVRDFLSKVHKLDQKSIDLLVEYTSAGYLLFSGQQYPFWLKPQP